MAEVEHLKMIQAVVSRMAGNSFLLRGWVVTVVAGLSAFAKADADESFAWIAAGVVVVFAFLDAYYLAEERAYRKLYGEAVAGTAAPWSLAAAPAGMAQIFAALGSIAVWPLHGAALVASVAVAVWA